MLVGDDWISIITFHLSPTLVAPALKLGSSKDRPLLQGGALTAGREAQVSEACLRGLPHAPAKRRGRLKRYSLFGTAFSTVQKLGPKNGSSKEYHE